MSEVMNLMSFGAHLVNGIPNHTGLVWSIKGFRNSNFPPGKLQDATPMLKIGVRKHFPKFV